MFFHFDNGYECSAGGSPYLYSTSSVPTRKQAKIWPLTIQKGCRVYLLKVGITMDLLHKELQRKKKALERAKQEAALDDGNNDNNNNKKTSGGGSSKFLRVGDLRRVEEEQEELQQHPSIIIIRIV